ARARPPRDHFTARPTSWVAGVCDRGRRHSRNEDAMALAAEDEPVRRAVLVVCDGVSTAPDSDRASMAAATAARDLLDQHRPVGLGTPESRAAAMEATMVDGGQAAHQAVVDGSDPAGDNAPSCTFAAAVVEGDLCVWGLVGDSRVYWLPDGGPGEQLGVDDSVAALRIAAGVEREVAESSAGAHAITRWLGSDSPDTMALTGSLPLDRPGWVLVCSDGLWNYVSRADRVHELVGRLVAGGHRDPLELAGALVGWANEQGGQDNVTVALARVGDDVPPAAGASAY
ncbi:PP2C family protein-serine/threonine phosphatase, partial [Desertihabitans aurantiacus]|uniref:PP2C family protein-serine/threonine phosphatase n=1 Tax=Desertihabitans aurantiacus TaxID=2282477 RepID=UPI000DF753AE